MSDSARQPVLFIGHGSPMNAIEDNRWSRALRELGAQLLRPRAVLAISAHWFEPAPSRLTAQARPQTIHDFGGFPAELFAVQYPAPGAPELAAQIAGRSDGRLQTTQEWGLDHGSWSVLRHLFPAADVPVIQLSMDSRLPPAAHLALGAQLAPLRDEGVLILGSGNIVHNLGHAFRAWRSGDTATPAWAQRFDSDIAAALQSAEPAQAVSLFQGSDAALSHPSPEHFLPLLYAIGAAGGQGPVDFPVSGFDMGSLSMRSVRFAALPA